jgi:hypothetical protein
VEEKKQNVFTAALLSPLLFSGRIVEGNKEAKFINLQQKFSIMRRVLLFGGLALWFFSCSNDGSTGSNSDSTTTTTTNTTTTGEGGTGGVGTGTGTGGTDTGMGTSGSGTGTATGTGTSTGTGTGTGSGTDTSRTGGTRH